MTFIMFTVVALVLIGLIGHGADGQQEDKIIQLKKLDFKPVVNKIYGRFVEGYCGRSTIVIDNCKFCTCRSDGLGWFCTHSGSCPEDEKRAKRDLDEYGHYIFRGDEIDDFFSELATGEMSPERMMDWTNGRVSLKRRRKRSTNPLSRWTIEEQEAEELKHAEAIAERRYSYVRPDTDDYNERFRRDAATTAAPTTPGGAAAAGAEYCPCSPAGIKYLRAIDVPKVVFYPAGNMGKFFSTLSTMFLTQYGISLRQELMFAADPAANPKPTMPADSKGDCPPCPG